jgi:carbonic anhydrase/acetyltransferase-like protein (isoleucine patch superfamily)
MDGSVHFYKTFVEAVNSHKRAFIGNHAYVMRKLDGAAAAIAAHGALVAIAIKIYHGKIAFGRRLKEDKPIGTNAKPTVAEVGNAFGRNRK